MSERGTPETDAGYKAHYAEHENNRKLCEHLERERDEAREALQFYADKESWQRVQQGAYDEPEIVIPALEDGGDRARAILAKAKP